MKRRFLMIAVAAALAAEMVSAQTNTSVVGPGVAPAVRDAIKAAGAAIGMEFKSNADNITSAEFWGSGTSGGSKIADFHAGIDYTAPMSMRIDYVKNGQRTIEAVSLDGNARTKFAWNETEPNGGAITPVLAEADQRQLRLWTLTPHAVLKAAVDAGEQTKVSKTANGSILTFPLANASCRDSRIFNAKDPCTNVVGQVQKVVRINFTVTLDSKNLIQKVETRAGTAVTDTTFSDYKDLSESKSGKLFPSHIVQKNGASAVWDLTVAKVDLDYPSVFIVTPDSVRQAASQASK